MIWDVCVRFQVVRNATEDGDEDSIVELLLHLVVFHHHCLGPHFPADKKCWNEWSPIKFKL